MALQGHIFHDAARQSISCCSEKQAPPSTFHPVSSFVFPPSFTPLVRCLAELTGHSSKSLKLGQEGRGPWEEMYVRCIEREFDRFGSAESSELYLVKVLHSQCRQSRTGALHTQLPMPENPRDLFNEAIFAFLRSSFQRLCQ